MKMKSTYLFVYKNGDVHVFNGVEHASVYADGSMQLIYDLNDQDKQITEVAPGYRYVTITREGK